MDILGRKLTVLWRYTLQGCLLSLTGFRKLVTVRFMQFQLLWYIFSLMDTISSTWIYNKNSLYAFWHHAICTNLLASVELKFIWQIFLPFIFSYEALWITVSSAKIISLLSHKATWALLRPMFIIMYVTGAPYDGPRGNKLMEHIFAKLIEQSMLSIQCCFCNFQARTHS